MLPAQLSQAPYLNKACKTMAAVVEDDWEGDNSSWCSQRGPFAQVLGMKH